MMRPGVEPEYLLKLDTHKHTILIFWWDFIFFASLLEPVNGHEIQIKYVVAKYPKGTSQDPT